LAQEIQMTFSVSFLARKAGLAAMSVTLPALGLCQSVPQERLATPAGLACSSDIRVQIESALAEVSKLKNMEQGKVFELPAGGKMMSGYGDDFLRRRTAQEVLASGLASGCGDYAISFIYRMEQCGFKTNFIDSAEISTQSLRTHDSGHTVVAVRNEAVGRWILADPTAGRVITENWNPVSKTFYGNYWIGYYGPVDQYPAHDHDTLKQFYAATLKTIPSEVMAEHLFRFKFVVVQSLIGKEGEYLNPRLAAFLRDNGKFLEELGIRPKREIEIRLVKGGDDALSRLDKSENGAYVCTVGLKSAMSLGFISYLEAQVGRRLRTEE
jgi:hypothetical protein